MRRKKGVKMRQKSMFNKISSQCLKFRTLSLWVVAVYLGLCMPLYGQGTLLETTTTMELQGELMNAETKAVTSAVVQPADANAPLPAAAGAPIVVKTSPQAFANDVEPSLGKITVTFDQPMTNASWSWIGGGDTYPKTAGQPSYDQGRTACSLAVKLEPNKVYWVGINSPSYQNFKSASGVPAKQYVILFATKGSDGEPTPIPADMLKEARAINEKTEPPANEVDAQKDANAPDVNDFNDFQRELSRINIEAKGEERQWLGRIDQKEELVKAVDDLATAELKFIRKLAESEGADKTTRAIDLMLKQRRERLAELTTKLENERREERQMPGRERRTRKTVNRQN